MLQGDDRATRAVLVVAIRHAALLRFETDDGFASSAAPMRMQRQTRSAHEEQEREGTHGN